MYFLFFGFSCQNVRFVVSENVELSRFHAYWYVYINTLQHQHKFMFMLGNNWNAIMEKQIKIKLLLILHELGFLKQVFAQNHSYFLNIRMGYLKIFLYRIQFKTINLSLLVLQIFVSMTESNCEDILLSTDW